MATEIIDGNEYQAIAPSIHQNSPSSCLCSTTPLDIWEMLIVNISVKEATTEDIIRCQKAVMSSCEALVHCHGCSSRSQDFILLVNICAKLLDSLKTQGAGLTAYEKEIGDRQAVSMPSEEHRVIGNRNGNHEDKDRNEVLRSLWTARMWRLGRLIARLSDLKDGEKRLAHTDLLKGLQVQFSGVMFGW